MGRGCRSPCALITRSHVPLLNMAMRSFIDWRFSFGRAELRCDSAGAVPSLGLRMPASGASGGSAALSLAFLLFLVVSRFALGGSLPPSPAALSSRLASCASSSLMRASRCERGLRSRFAAFFA